MTDPLQFVFVIGTIVLVLALPALAAVWLFRTMKLHELRHRQLLAMIEKGIAPAPEANPAAFDGLLGRRRRSIREERFKSGGIMLAGLGVAMALVIGVAGGQARVGLGVGGAIATIGIAMVVSALLSRAEDEVPPAHGHHPTESAPAEMAPPVGRGDPLA